jgi:DNA polymerase-3 subunit delta
MTDLKNNIKETSKPSNGVYLFYGEDDFSLRRKIDKWKEEFAKKYSAQAIMFLDGADLSETDLIKKLQEHLAPSLFSAKSLIILRDALPRKADQEKLITFLLDLPAKVSAGDFVVFWQTTKPDGRLKFTKEFKLLANVTEFNLPAGRELDGWLVAMAKTMDTQITPAAADLLAQFMGRDLAEEKKAGGRVIERKEAYDLWQVHSELAKLASSTDQITPELVRALVRPKLPDSVFILTNQIAANNRQGAFEALENFMVNSNSDEKNAFIKIIGLLAEQVRGLLSLSLLQAEGLSNDVIAEKLGWTNGRVFMVSKNSKNFSILKLTQLLKELCLIDAKLKSTDKDPNLLVDLFLTRATG